MITNDLTILRGSDVAALLAGRERDVVAAVADAYLSHRDGQTVLPRSSFLKLAGEANPERIIALPAMLNDASPIAGLKWIASVPENLDRGIPRASAVLIANCARTGRPTAILESSLISSSRTAASAALAAKTIHGTRETCVGIIGCGVINFQIARYLKLLIPSLKRFVLYDIRRDCANAFASRIERTLSDVTCCVESRLDAALDAAALLSFATTATRPYVLANSTWPSHATILHVSLRDLSPTCVGNLDNVVDDVEHVLAANTSVDLARKNAGHHRFIRCTLADILAGAAPARDGTRPVVFSPFGLGILDLAVARLVLNAALTRRAGLTVKNFLINEGWNGTPLAASESKEGTLATIEHQSDTNPQLQVPRTVAIVTNNTNCERHVQYYTTLEKYFMANSWVIADSFDVDMVVISGCGFHNMMLEKVKSLLADLKAVDFRGQLVMTGCIPTTHAEEWRRGFQGTLVELSGEAALDGLIGAAVPFKDVRPVNVLKLHKDTVASDESQVLHVKVADGCIRQCSFCAIHRAKGRIRSLQPEVIHKQIEDGIAAGYRRIFLMGEDTFAYGIDIGTTIIELVESVLSHHRQIQFQFGNLDHRWLVEYVDQIISLCNRGAITQLHVGIQHNNDHLLVRMGRGGIPFRTIYDAIAKLKTACPQLYLGVDVIVGFPGETEEMFSGLMEFFEHEPYIDNVQHNGFSAIAGAPAAAFVDQVAPAVIAARWYRLTRLLQRRTAFNRDNQRSNFDVTFRDTRDRAYSFVKDTVQELPDLAQGRSSEESRAARPGLSLPVIA